MSFHKGFYVVKWSYIGQAASARSDRVQEYNGHYFDLPGTSNVANTRIGETKPSHCLFGTAGVKWAAHEL